jgi:hypothetical protein
VALPPFDPRSEKKLLPQKKETNAALIRAVASTRSSAPPRQPRRLRRHRRPRTTRKSALPVVHTVAPPTSSAPPSSAADLPESAVPVVHNALAPPSSRALFALALVITCLAQLAAGDTNGVYEPCSDAWIQRGDGFSFGVVFTGYNTFFSGNTQLSPCDRRLNLASSAQLAVFRPKVDEISLLTINSTTEFNPVSNPFIA